MITMALIGCKGAYLLSDFSRGSDSHPIDREVAIFPDVRMESLDEEVPSVMKPIFDAVWNMFGLERSFNYDENGIWKPRQ